MILQAPFMNISFLNADQYTLIVISFNNIVN